MDTGQWHKSHSMGEDPRGELGVPDGCGATSQRTTQQGNMAGKITLSCQGLTKRSKEVKADGVQEGAICSGIPHSPGHVQITMVVIGVHTLDLFGSGHVTGKRVLKSKGGTHWVPWVNCNMCIKAYTWRASTLRKGSRSWPAF